MPHWVRPDDEPVRGQQGNCQPPYGHFSAGRTGQACGVRWNGQISVRSALARLPAILRVLPRRQRRRAGRQSSDRLDWFGREDDRTLWPTGFANAAQRKKKQRGGGGRKGQSEE